jgi:DNA-binding SARP family transcriptional activator/tetratricopeptide (TPR) repeat protein
MPSEERSSAAVATAPRGHRLQARVLGGFSVTVDDRKVEPDAWRRASAERLVKLLLVTPGHRLSREAAAEHLWPDTDPDHQGPNLRKALHFARRALLDESDASPILVADRTHVAIDPAVEVRVDIDELLEANRRIDAAATGDAPPDAVATILDLGAAELLPDDPYEDWLATPREMLATKWTAVAVHDARTALDRGDVARAGPLIDALLARDPADEEAHRLAITMLGSQGRHHAARRQFFQCRRELAAAFGVEPSTETVEALARVEAATAVSRQWPRPGPRLVGRDAELTRIDQFIERLPPRRGGALVIRGPAGIGKSRLLEETTAMLATSGWRVLEARAAEDDGLVFAPLRAAFRRISADEVAAWPEPAASSIALLVPGLGLEPMIPFTQRGALAAGVSTAIGLLTARQPVVLAIDDAQWLDEGSADLLRSVVAATADQPFIVAFAVRSDEAMGERVRGLLDALRRVPGEDVEVAALNKSDVATLVSPHLGGAKLDGAAAEFLFDRSRGNPLFCLELARMARDEGRFALRGGTWRLAGPTDPAEVPPTVARLVRARCARLDSTTLDVLRLAAEFDEPIQFDDLTRASGTPPDVVVQSLDEGIAAGLLGEAPSGYRFAHPLFLAALRHEASAARRPTVLLAVARALARDVDPCDPAAIKAAVASGLDPAAVAERALEAAEAGLAEARALAVGFGIEAGLRASRLLQREIALATLQRALTLWSSLPDAEQYRFIVSSAYAALGQLLVTAGRDTEAIEAYRRAIKTGRTAAEIGAAYAAISFVGYRHADYGSAMAYLHEGLARAGDDELLWAILMTEVGWLEFRHQRLEDSLSHLREAEAVFRRVGSDVWLMRVLDSVWAPLESMGRGGEGEAGLQTALEIAERLRDAAWEARVRTHLAFRCVAAGVPAQARPHVERGRALARMMGDLYTETVVLWSAAEMELALGNAAAAQDCLAAQVALLKALGGNPRQEAIAHALWTHVAHALDDGAAAAREEGLARQASVAASRGDAEFGRRIESYLAAPAWVPMSM